MAYASNVLIRKHMGKKVIVCITYNDVEGMFDKFPDECFVMAHSELVGGSPMITLNGEIATAGEWYKVVHKHGGGLPEDYNPKSYWGYTISQLLTASVWICKKVKNLYS